MPSLQQTDLESNRHVEKDSWLSPRSWDESVWVKQCWGAEQWQVNCCAFVSQPLVYLPPSVSPAGQASLTPAPWPLTCLMPDPLWGMSPVCYWRCFSGLLKNFSNCVCVCMCVWVATFTWSLRYIYIYIKAHYQTLVINVTYQRKLLLD